MYKLAVLDIDGTLIDNKGNISKKTMQTIAEVEQSGGIVTICTGRNIRKALPVAKKANIKAPIGCIDGAVLVDPQTNNIIEGLEFSQYEIDLILSAAEGKEVFVEINTGYIYHKFAEKEKEYRYDIFNKRTLLGRIRSYVGGIRYIKNWQQLRKITLPVYQIVIAGKTDVIAEIKNTIQQGDCSRIDIREHLWDKYLFINRKGGNKASGVQRLCDYFGIAMSETITMGDDKNDIDMLEEAGLGIAMGNAHESIQKIADYVTASNEEDGVALALEKFFLKK